MDKIRVLLVDDEGELVTTMAERLEYRDIVADSAISGVEALNKVRANPYDVIIIDLKMPGMSGAEVIRTIKKEYPDLPLFLMTGHGFSLDGEEIPPGIVDYLPKPIKIDVLVEKIQGVLKKRTKDHKI